MSHYSFSGFPVLQAQAQGLQLLWESCRVLRNPNALCLSCTISGVAGGACSTAAVVRYPISIAVGTGGESFAASAVQAGWHASMLCFVGRRDVRVGDAAVQ
jgi:hypothetical protein